MKEGIVEIVEEYLENRRFKKNIPTSEFRFKLRKLNQNEEQINDLLLKMDDEWTKEQFMRAKLKTAKTNFILGITVSILAVLLAILGYLGYLAEGRVFIFYYGAIAGGIVLAIKGNHDKFVLTSDLERRKSAWKNWC